MCLFLPYLSGIKMTAFQCSLVSSPVACLDLPYFSTLFLKRRDLRAPIFLARFESDLNFVDRFSETSQLWNFMKIRSVGTELLFADRQRRGWTFRHYQVVYFRNFAKTPKNSYLDAAADLLVSVKPEFKP